MSDLDNYKIAIIVQSRLKKGPVIVASILAKKLIQDGHSVTVWYFRETNDDVFTGIRTKKVRFSSLSEITNSQIIHSHSLRPDLLNYFLKVTKISKAKHVTTIHNFVKDDLLYDYGRIVSILVSSVWLWSWRRLDLCVSLSRRGQRYYSNLSLTTKVINNGVDLAPSDQKINIYGKIIKEDIQLISTSSLTKRKNLSLLIEALYKNKHLSLVLLGNGPELKNLKDEADKLGVINRLTFMGFKENVYEALLGANIFVLPSRSEGHPLGLIEAASIGLPSLVSDIPELREFFNTNEVIYFNPDSTEDFGRALEICLSNYSSYSQNIRSKYDKEYTGSIMYQNYLKLYEELINK